MPPPGSHPFPLKVNFPSPVNHPRWHHPSQPPQGICCQCPPWGWIRNRSAGVPLPSPPAARPWHHLLQGHWASSQPCRDAACCRAGHRGAEFCLLWASWHRVPPGPGITALGTTGCWHRGTGYCWVLASWHQGIQQVTASRKDGADVATRCRCAGTARLICRCLLANATGAPRVGWEQSLAGHSCVLKAKLIAGRVVGMVRTGRKRL